jgi:PKD repeat protein
MLTVTVDSTATNDPDTDLLHHTWDWGDGTSFYSYADLKTTHSYTKAGTYKVVLTVTDPFDTPVVSDAVTVTVGAGEAANLALFMTFDDLADASGNTKDCSTNAAVGVVPAGVTADANGVRHTAAKFTAGPGIAVTSNALCESRFLIFSKCTCNC